MEPPVITETCSKMFCNLTDFIPVRCNQCNRVFCLEHIAYINHDCASSTSSGVQIPICPLCDVSLSLGPYYGIIELAATAHVDQECRSAIAVARRQWIIQHIRSNAW